MKQQKHKLIKRVLSVVLSLSMALCLIPSTVFAEESTDWVQNESEKTVSIYTATGLREWADTVRERNNAYDGYTISIENDIDLGDAPWTSIISLGGTVTIDGKNHTISNMRISEQENGSDGNTYLGFIGNLNYNTKLTVQNITFANAHVQDLNGDTEYSWCGVVVGHGPMDGVNESQAECTFTNVKVTNSVVTGGHNNGAILGYSCSTEKGILFDNCTVTNSFVGGYNSTSGILFGMGIANVEVRNCTADGVVLYSDGLNFNCSQSKDDQLWLGNVYPQEIYGDRYGSNGKATYNGTNNWGSSYVAYPVISHYADGDVQEYVKVNTPLSGTWYSDSSYTQPVLQITADMTDADMYPYGKQTIVNEQTYITQDVTKVANPLTHAAIELYTTDQKPKKISYPGMDKTIVGAEGDGNEDTVAAGDTVKFQLESNVPENLKDYITYPVDDPEISTLAVGTAGTYALVFHDEMAEELVLNKDSFEIKLGDDVIDSQYYAINYDPTDDCTFEVSIDLAAMYNDDVITEADLGITPITVNYTATLAEDAAAGAYTNTSWVVYPDGESEPDTVTVITYGIKIFKYDSADPQTGLSGAVFEIYQKDTDGSIVNKKEVTTLANGLATLNGLDEGTYYIKETQAPNGYVCSDQELEINIPVQADADKIVTVNFANTQIPHTGGMGTTLYTVGGAVIVAAAAVLFVISRKKRQSK